MKLLNARPLLLLLLTGLLTTGCTTKKATQTDPIYIPPLPGTPRLQLLTSINSSQGIEKESRLMAFLTGQKKPPKPIFKPYGVTIHQGKIYICDTQARGIEVIDLAAKTFDYWHPEGAGQFKKPINIVFDEKGNRYITDVERGEVLRFDAQENFTGAFGGLEELKPSGIAVGGGKIYVTNLLKSRVDVHDAGSLEYLHSIPRDLDNKASKLFSPTNLDLDQDLNLYVSDTGGVLLKVFDVEGNLLRGLGQPGTGIGQLIRPRGIAADREKRIYIVDAATEVVQIFDSENRLLLFVGKADGTNYPLVLPAGICIDYDHVDLFRSYAAPDFEVEYLVLVINQYGGRKLHVYGFGQQKP